MKSHLLKTLTKYSATAASLLIIRQTADAQIVYTDIPDTLITDGFYFLDLNNDAAFDYRFKRGDFNTTYVSVEGVISGNSMLGSATVSAAYVYPFNLDALDPISNNQPFHTGIGILAGGGGNNADFDGAIDGYLGLKFLIGGAPHFGWVRLDVSPDADWFVVKDFAYQSVPGETILAGQTDSGGDCIDNFEPNNSHQNATPVSEGVAYHALIAQGIDIDFYAIQLTAEKPNLKLDLTDLPKNYNLRLLNSTGQLIAKSVKNLKFDEQIIANNLNSGKYYAVVYPKDQAKFNANKCYTFQFETNDQPFKISSDESIASSTEITIFPNPVSSTATIQFILEKKSAVTIELFDLQGRKIKTIADENFSAGNHELNFECNQIISGHYMVLLKSEQSTVIRRLIIQ